MDIATLNKTLDLFYSIFERIGVVQLFGGEPSLNLPAIEFVCKYMKGNNEASKIGMVTNGTNLTDEIVNLIRGYDLQVTVSLDCNATHDDLRPFFNSAKSSYHTIISNIRRLYKCTGQPNQIEVTYTRLHEDLGITVSQLMKSIYSDIGFTVPVHIAPVCSDDAAYKLLSINPFIESIYEWFSVSDAAESLPHSFVARFLGPLKNKVANTSFCGGGTGTLSVSCNGYIYPCFYFINQTGFDIGNVCNADANIVEEKLIDLRENYQNHQRNALRPCADCFANTVCFGCYGINHFTTGNQFVASTFHCSMVREGLLATLRSLILRKNKNAIPNSEEALV